MSIHKFDPSNSNILISSERKKFLNPLKIKGLFNANTRMVCDLGCGNGFFTIPICRWLDGKGKVFAVDISEQMLEELGLRAKKLGIRNLIIRSSGENKIPISNKTMDIVFMACVIHEVKNPYKFLLEAKRILKDRGRVIVIDWKKMRMNEGPPYNVRIGKKKAMAYLKMAGFKDIEEMDLYPYHYVLIGRYD